jgi:SOS response regulatory protein OraA/RecX
MIEKIALRLLALKSQSRTELKKKLLKRGFTPAEIEPLLARYQALGYINDTELTERRVETFCRRGYGPRWIQGKLRQQGLKAPVYPIEEQKRAIKKLLSTTPFLRKTTPQKMAALQRRGFDFEAIVSQFDDGNF